jgi:hypothetical protein
VPVVYQEFSPDASPSVRVPARPADRPQGERERPPDKAKGNRLPGPFDAMPKDFAAFIKAGELLPIDESVLHVLVGFRPSGLASCWTFKGKVAEKLGVSTRTVQRSYERLSQAGLIEQKPMTSRDPEAPMNRTGWRIIFLWMMPAGYVPGPGPIRAGKGVSSTPPGETSVSPPPMSWETSVSPPPETSVSPNYAGAPSACSDEIERDGKYDRSEPTDFASLSGGGERQDQTKAPVMSPPEPALHVSPVVPARPAPAPIVATVRPELAAEPAPRMSEEDVWRRSAELHSRVYAGMDEEIRLRDWSLWHRNLFRLVKRLEDNPLTDEQIDQAVNNARRQIDVNRGRRFSANLKDLLAGLPIGSQGNKPAPAPVPLASKPPSAVAPSVSVPPSDAPAVAPIATAPPPAAEVIAQVLGNIEGYPLGELARRFRDKMRDRGVILKVQADGSILPQGLSGKTEPLTTSEVQIGQWLKAALVKELGGVPKTATEAPPGAREFPWTRADDEGFAVTKALMAAASPAPEVEPIADAQSSPEPHAEPVVEEPRVVPMTKAEAARAKDLAHLESMKNWMEKNPDHPFVPRQREILAELHMRLRASDETPAAIDAPAPAVAVAQVQTEPEPVA